MNKKSVRNKNIFKGTVFGVALLMCGSFVPVGAIQSLATTISQDTNPSKTDGQIAQNTNRIEVNANSVASTENKGGEFTIPKGHYFGKSNVYHVIGTYSDSLTSRVVAYYEADGSIVYDSNDNEKYPEAKFGADRVGKYIVEYTVTDAGETYSYKLEFKCVVADATFEFDTNDSNIIPSVYDLALCNAKNSYNDIKLPIPAVLDENGDKISGVKIVLDGESADSADYMQISLDQAFSDDLGVTRSADGSYYYISGEALKQAAGHEFKIVYKFFQNGVQIASTEKSFTVSNKYYTDSENKAGYNLTIALASSKPSSAVVGVAKALPSITATTSSSDSPASEAVSVSYKINVYKRVNGAWQIVEKTLDEENNFTAPSAGDYKFEYVAVDFYGNEAKTEFTITDVKDTVSATPYIYDAGDESAKNEDGSYKSAENYLKSVTANRNIIMYAIGGHDNNVSEDELTLTREIRTSSGTLLYQISSSLYNQYNLIFKASKKNDGTSVYKSIYDDNYHIREQMILDGITDTSDETIKNWLKNKYLIVTKSRTVDPISGEEYGAELSDAQLLEKGYAYIEPNSANLDFTEQVYTFYYIADDNVDGNNATQSLYTVEVKENTDDMSVPSILYSTELQSSYLNDDVINLTAPTASDEGGDSSVALVTAYRYLDSSRNPIESKGETIRYIINDASKNAVSGNKWYVQAGENNIVTSKGWTILEGEDEYQIKLKSKPVGAAYIEFFSYAIDDEGNVGFYDKQIYVSDIQDDVAPYLYQVVSSDENSFVNNKTFILPTLYYEDNMPQYMNAGVVVYKVDEQDGTEVVHSANMKTYYDSYTGTYVLEAGSFTPSTGGKYQVAVTVTDAGKHSITTYFTYNIEGIPVVEEPEITNISKQAKEIVIGEEQILSVPKLYVSESSEIGYIGLSEYDSETVADYYNVTAISADSTDYVLDGNKFVANSRGTYKLQYNVSLISYSTSEKYFSTSSEGENGKLFLKTNETTGATMLAYKAKGGEKIVGKDGVTATAGDVFYIYINNKNVNELIINSNVKGTGNSIAISDLPVYTEDESVVTLHTMKSDIITFTAGEVAVNLNMDSSVYTKTKYEDTTSSLVVKPIDAEVSGSGTIDKDKSNVSISVSSGSTVRTIATISINDWNNKNLTENSDIYFDDTTGDLILNLNTNGKYTIEYTVKAKNGNGAAVGSEKTISYEISVGDVIAPELEIDNTDNSFISSTYEVGDVLNIKVDKIKATDNSTVDENQLLKNLVIQVTNTSSNETKTLENTSDKENEYAYSYEIKNEGSYKVSIYVRDAAGNKSSTREFTFTVGDDTSNPVNVTEIVGKVLIGVSVAILAGVVVYFIVSKVKENKSKKSK